MDENRHGANLKMEIFVGLEKQQQKKENRYGIELKAESFDELENTSVRQIQDSIKQFKKKSQIRVE